MRNNSIKHDYDSKLKNHMILSFKLYLYIACFTFLSFRLLKSFTGAAYADSTADNGQKLSQSGVLTSVDKKSISGLELLRADISITKSENDTKSAERLKRIIEQIRSVEFKPKNREPEPVVVPEKAPVIEANETVPDVPVQKEQVKQQAKSKPPYEPITDQTLQMLKSLAKNPEKLDNPLELAETLFFSGKVKEASFFYTEALRHKDPNDVSSFNNRAWILFQIGNCLRKDDLPAAAKSYQQLLTEYPNSPWVEPAKAQSDLVTWYLRDEPAKLMLQVKNAAGQQDSFR